MKAKIGFAIGAVLLATSAVIAGAGPSTHPARFAVLPLVADQPGIAPNTDPDLGNPFGVAHGPAGPLWVSDNATGKSTLYDRNTGQKQSLVVNIPGGAPTGIAFVPAGIGFPVRPNTVQQNAVFVFATETGRIAGWNPKVDLNNALVIIDHSKDGAVYKGMALDAASKRLFVTNFTQNRVEIYDNRFKQVGAFTDATLPRRFAPFGIAVLNGKVYVTFAKREKNGIDDVDRPGFGYVDVFSTDGVLQQHLIANGELNAPWGMTIAPSGFGKLGGALLVGNFGDGHVHAYDADTGRKLGPLFGTDGKPLFIRGLWALDAGPNANVTFSEGLEEETHGRLGLLSVPQASNK